ELMVMLRVWVTTLAALVGLTAVPAAAQPRPQTVLVTAVERNGDKPVTTLTPEDVIVREDGVAREILSVTPVPSPALLVLVADNSQAARRAIQDMRLALTEFVETFSGPHSCTYVAWAGLPSAHY